MTEKILLDKDKPEPKILAQFKTEYMGHSFWSFAIEHQEIARAFVKQHPTEGPSGLLLYVIGPSQNTSKMAYVGHFEQLNQARMAVERCLEYVLWPI